MKAVRIIVGIGIIGVFLMGAMGVTVDVGSMMEINNRDKAINESQLAPTSDQLIRFHVLANSDSEQDQKLKRAVRDAILKDVAPRLAASQSLDESRQILKLVRADMESIGRSVVTSWGKDYTVSTEYGNFSFPTKSYGSLVLPAGEYEALRVVIGEGQGSNWWCVLFPPLCFVDIEQSTAVQVDGKQGVPINRTIKQTENSTSGSPKVRFYFWERIKQFLDRENA
ncbi:stage II sporulation protein R [Desulfosporosinus fructosivorans]|uniref:Stage II sporulation protein R n=1 Tax=Desulfosporosinus fructosivorans TaxID=2018669 RepID=A0A4Z0R0G3_9FIRM|nr:stage II sporulation protein R [Desulfosporosinus fructosivorans]TGE36521.1 stage II sporulation protein R [Desulfosporosinus fructosivorans]